VKTKSIPNTIILSPPVTNLVVHILGIVTSLNQQVLLLFLNWNYDNWASIKTISPPFSSTRLDLHQFEFIKFELIVYNGWSYFKNFRISLRINFFLWPIPPCLCSWIVSVSFWCLARFFSIVIRGPQLLFSKLGVSTQRHCLSSYIVGGNCKASSVVVLS